MQGLGRVDMTLCTVKSGLIEKYAVGRATSLGVWDELGNGCVQECTFWVLTGSWWAVNVGMVGSKCGQGGQRMWAANVGTKYASI